MWLLAHGSTLVACVTSALSPQRERQAQREGALELTEKLDQDWKEIQTLLTHRAPKSENRDKKEQPKVGIELTAPFCGEMVEASVPSGLFLDVDSRPPVLFVPVSSSELS